MHETPHPWTFDALARALVAIDDVDDEFAPLLAALVFQCFGGEQRRDRDRAEDWTKLRTAARARVRAIGAEMRSDDDIDDIAPSGDARDQADLLLMRRVLLLAKVRLEEPRFRWLAAHDPGAWDAPVLPAEPPPTFIDTGGLGDMDRFHLLGTKLVPAWRRERKLPKHRLGIDRVLAHTHATAFGTKPEDADWWGNRRRKRLKDLERRINRAGSPPAPSPDDVIAELRRLADHLAGSTAALRWTDE